MTASEIVLPTRPAAVTTSLPAVLPIELQSLTQIPYGPHLMGDLPGCDPAKMLDGPFIYRFMNAVVSVAEMRPIGSPHLDLYTGPHKEWEGFSATVHIQTSHITAHFFAFGYVFCDLFSCRPFDREKTRRFIEAELEPSAPAIWCEVSRGRNFPVALIDAAQVATHRGR